jgi:hypothetical protein
MHDVYGSREHKQEAAARLPYCFEQQVYLIFVAIILIAIILIKKL